MAYILWNIKPIKKYINYDLKIYVWPFVGQLQGVKLINS